MTDRKYILHPGIIVSRNDAQRHRIGAGKLAELYRVPISECLVCAHCQGRQMLPCENGRSGYTDLFPRSSGNYDLPERNK